MSEISEVEMKNHMTTWVEMEISPRGRSLMVEDIRGYQGDKILKLLNYVKNNSQFYKEYLKNVRVDESRLFEDFCRVPTTSPEQIYGRENEFLAIPLGSVKRIVTAETSGSSQKKKRIFFSDRDLERTMDFFHNGMKNIVDASDRVLILLPGSAPDSLADLLKRGIERIGTVVVEKSMEEDVFATMARENVTTLICAPTQMEVILDGISEVMRTEDKDVSLSSVLLTAEYVSEDLRERVMENFQCKVYEHYGMTEMGYGCAVSCQCLEGYHIREQDIYIEIVDSHFGTPVADGNWGEIVFTGLTQEAMPLIRYRTGDVGRILTGCKCGSPVRRLDRVKDRGIVKGWLL